MTPEEITLNLPYPPNTQQRLVIEALCRFCSPQAPSDSIFILNGYAGTGKTSLTGALVKTLATEGTPVVLLAPTGRAAKVFSQSAGMPAYTIHRRIYHASVDPSAGMCHILRDNSLENALFIVDEASMIPDENKDAMGNPVTSLLDDLLQFVFTGNNCRLLLLGDVAQLPPVGTDQSPALDAEALKGRGFNVSRAKLTAVARQQSRSMILRNATWQRKAMLLPKLPRPLVTQGADVAIIPGEDLPDMMARFYHEKGPDSTIIITRSNWRAAGFNQAVRSQVIDCQEELRTDERLIVVKNNYMWAHKRQKTDKKDASQRPAMDFIANGDMARVTTIYGYEEKHGFRFADVALAFPDSDAEIDCKILLDTLAGETPSLEPERFRQLAQARLGELQTLYPTLTYDQWLRRLREDEYFNALQVKYAYAVTCHKAQGGQWENVIVDMGGIDLESPTLDFYRWLYTATTRARSRLYFLNLQDRD